MRLLTIVLPVVVSTALSTSGCARGGSRKPSPYDQFPLPASDRIYLFVSNEYEPPEKIIQAIKKNTVYALLRVVDDVKIIHRTEEVGHDGLLLKIDIVYVGRTAVSKRIDIRYRLTDNATKTEILKRKAATRSKFGFNKVSVALGKRVAADVNRVLINFRSRRKSVSP